MPYKFILKTTFIYTSLRKLLQEEKTYKVKNTQLFPFQYQILLGGEKKMWYIKKKNWFQFLNIRFMFHNDTKILNGLFQPYGQY